ncbi:MULTISPECIES: OpgC domain-containing protein [unclassified Bradyrhizobium]|uniref:OpgC family protein n=1 Tax=unclassified Bradyrhizobium TaxID=2631580 RepID=UPI0009EBE73C|nr:MULTISPECIES: OpgC domain-containing protein [unclassified Bradyrhizobium]
MTKITTPEDHGPATKTPARDGRDLRLDLFRGLANWAIFLDHIPNNAVAWLTTRNYGFSDAADLFVFISGYTAALAYSKPMRRDGFWAGAVKLMRRVWQIYVAHILLFVVYVAAIGWVAQTYRHSHLLDEFNVAGLIANPIGYLTAGLLLKFKPLNMDVLPLYIVLMAFFPVVLRAILALPNATLLCSLGLYFLAPLLGWNLPAWPEGVWYFNPFAWQLLFVLGAWSALGGATQAGWLLTSPAALGVCILYLVFALIVALPQNLGMQSSALASVSNGLAIDDKTNLAPSRLLHFMALAILTVHLVPRRSRWLGSPVLRPMLLCGRHSLEVFCVGIFLSFVGHFLLELISDSLPMQLAVSIGGIAILIAVAWLRSWSPKDSRNPSGPDPSSADARRQ